MICINNSAQYLDFILIQPLGQIENYIRLSFTRTSESTDAENTVRQTRIFRIKKMKIL